MRPQPGTTIIDPAAGTGGFLLSAAGYIANVLFFDRKPASETPWTRTLWIYDLRTNTHFTLKTNTLTRADQPRSRAPRFPVTTFYIFYLIDFKAFPLARCLESLHPPATIGVWNAS
jgi:hypothetical protein